MALHGDIKINHQLIGQWSAVRQEPLDSIDQTSTYKCEVRWFVPHGLHKFTLAHKYSDGAVSLVSKIMLEAHESRMTR